MPGAFELDQREHDVAYAAIEDYAFEGKTPSDSPRIIFLGGQPGCGKTKLLHAGLAEFEHNAVQINVDDLRRFHPHKVQIREQDDNYSSSHAVNRCPGAFHHRRLVI